MDSVASSGCYRRASKLVQEEKPIEEQRVSVLYVDGEVHSKVRESGRSASKTMDSRWPYKAPLSKPKENFGQAVAEEEDAMWLP
ncbi:hypothetical protein B296_00026340 [Ensete ventricosum]|uniref:Uncharacterized protein n=1 Tax=Ensete ventricosum TaxID=4639 RepID=A0A427AHL3_ENSVE|nr:hypothetical protein B296_00026340 [Ensete ventricosum]